MDLLSLKRAVAFFAHSDDEMICAGTLHRLAQSGCEVWIVTASTAGTQGDSAGGKHAWETLRPEFSASGEVISAKLSCLRLFPSKRLADMAQDLADAVFAKCEELKPDLVISLSPDDENPAHAVVGVQVRRVTRGRVPIHVEVQFPWNHSLGRPNLYVSLSPEDVEAKRACIRCYKSQAHRYRYEEMLMAQVVADGEAVKVRAAERFELVRGVI